MVDVSTPDSRYAWLRLSISLVAMTIGCGAQYAMTVALLPLQAEFSASRAEVSLPYTLAMAGFAVGGVVMGKVADRYGVAVPLFVGAIGLGSGYIAAAGASSLLQVNIAFGLLIGLLGISATLAPLVADTALWFERRRGIAVAICASGNYLAGALWPPALQYFFELYGWRATFVGAGVVCMATMIPLALLLRRRAPVVSRARTSGGVRAPETTHALSPNTMQTMLCIAGVACCVAMSMPQVHIVAFCSDLGYAAARGAEMLSLMLGFGILSRLLSGWICDRIGGLRTLLIGSVLQASALALFLPSEGLTALYGASIIFGLVQGGIVPAYAIVVREHFQAGQTGFRTALVLSSTIFGMAVGGWMAGAIFDLTGSYTAAFVNGIAWNLLNVFIAIFLLKGSRIASNRLLPA